MKDKIIFRSFKEGDYENCREWWKWWWGRKDTLPVARIFLPKDERCYVIEKNGVSVASLFLYLMYDVPAHGWATYLVSNPKYKKKDRRNLIKMLIKGVEKEAENYGILKLFGVIDNQYTAKMHEDLQWELLPAKFEAFKFIESNYKKVLNKK